MKLSSHVSVLFKKDVVCRSDIQSKRILQQISVTYYPLAVLEKAIIIMTTFVISLPLHIKTITQAFVCQIISK